MKSYTLMTVASLVMSLPLGLAAQTEEGHEAHHPGAGGATPAVQPPAPGAAAPAVSEQAAPSGQVAGTEPPASAALATPLQTAMQQMREQMERIRQTTDSPERQRLLQEHLRSLQDAMKMLEGMAEAQMTAAGPQAGMMGRGMMRGGCPMMGGGQQGGQQSGMMGKGMGGMMQRHMMMESRVNLMERRLNGMQMLMDQMLQHLSATQGGG